MNAQEDVDPEYLTFSQAQGYEKIPGPLALGEISGAARIKLWNLFVGGPHNAFVSHTLWDSPQDLEDRWQSIFQMLHEDFLHRPMDEFPSKISQLVQTYREAILHRLPFNKLFDLVQMVMRHKQCPRDFILDVAAIFKKCRLAYVVDTESPVTILPAATTQEGEELMGAIREFREAGLSGAETHLRKAGERVNQGDWSGSVEESILAVESVARQLDPDASKTLGPALNSLEKSGQLHPALKKAFSNLYGYTSDEQGIRHALIDNPTSSVGKDEALFMLGACASFASYLWRRHSSES